MRRRTRLVRVTIAAALTTALVAVPSRASAQYFGQNKVQHRNFEFTVLKTEHFDIYYYPAEAVVARQVGRMAERWHARLSDVLGFTLTGRQPLVLYASHPEFQQTHVVEGMIGEGTGGITEGGRRRIVMPIAATLADTDHVLGHEIVHAFQYDILGMRAGMMPLWAIEGMAEYLSLGPRHPQTAMWLRDAAYGNRLPTVSQLYDPRYFPYRFGHAFWSYVAGRWGDRVLGQVLSRGSMDSGALTPEQALESLTGLDPAALSAAWHADIRATFDIPEGTPPPAGTIADAGTVIGERTGSGRLNVGPSLNPNGRRIAYLTEGNRLSVDLYLADAGTGEVIRRLTSTATDPHFESLQFLASAGAWDPEGQQLAVATVRNGHPVLAIFDASSGDLVREIAFETLPDLGEIFNPAWSPNGRTIAFAGQAGGATDLYVHTIATGETRRLTNDLFADLQPVWSPDSESIAFVTERFSSSLETLSFPGLELGLVRMSDGAIRRVETGLTGHHVNPEWADEGATVYFVADATGRPDVYRVPAAGDRPATPVASAPTGISGVTPVSPAISVARIGDRAAVTVLRDGGYEIHIVERPALTPAPARDTDLAALPPLTRVSTTVTEYLSAPATNLPPPDVTFDEDDYSTSLSLVGIGQQVGVSTGGYGTFLSGGIALQFSDVLGEHVLGVGAGIAGGPQDFGAVVSYLNRRHRWNWGLFAERAPLRGGFGTAGLVEIDGQIVYVEQTELYRQINTQVGGLLAYPLSRATRVEFSAAARHIGFDRELKTYFFDAASGAFLGETTEDLPAAESLKLGDVSAALVRDTSIFGLTGPIDGQRLRFEIAPTVGDLQMTNVTMDFRQYVMPVVPVTIAGRVFHFGRYGAGGEDERLSPIFLGYPSLVRGYDSGSFEAGECTPEPGDSCPEFNQLLGSRILVTGLEMRAPVVGLFRGRMDYGAVPVDLVAFADAGVAWTSDTKPTFADGTRRWVTSAGVGARVNLFGFVIAEFDVVRPFNRPRQGWMYLFSFRPGF